MINIANKFGMHLEKMGKDSVNYDKIYIPTYILNQCLANEDQLQESD